MKSLADLERAPVTELEDLFASTELFQQPEGVFRGRLLGWLDSPEARHPVFRPALTLMFGIAPFGVNFDERCWFFLDRRLKTGHFRISSGPSAWRMTETYRLEYGSSRLPGPIKGLLYDEVKPLSERLCLGIGGLKLSGRPSEVFLFGLELIEP